MSLADAPEQRTGSFSEILLLLKSDDGKLIGEMSRDLELSRRLSTSVQEYVDTPVVSVLAQSSRRSRVISK
jgi:hypothetical protein